MRLPFVAAFSGVAALAILVGVSVYISRVRQAPPAAKPVHAVLHAVRPKAVARKIEPSKIEPVEEVQLPSAFALENAMTTHARMQRWTPLIAEASKRFGVPQSWIRAVMLAESGGRTMLSENRPIISSAGAMGLMQLMPSTYADMRAQYGLGPDPYDPHDNVIAGAAYLRWLREKYDYPQMFAAYNDGPGNLEQRLAQGNLLPPETRLYLVNVTASVEGRKGTGRLLAQLTRPNGEPVLVDCSAVVRVRAAMPDEYAPGVLTVVTVGKIRQGVREAPARATAIIRAHGGAI
jgi:soluble lytic murein transglycosylase-like protein